jgi:parallel beta-helix repeat protein
MNYGSLTIGSKDLPLPRPTFNDCYSLGSIGESNIEYSDFINSSLYLGDDPALNHTATVDNCSFTTNINHPIDNLAVTHLKNYYITNNVFDGGLYGIGLYYDGSASNNNLVQNNQIHDCTAGGLFIYQSKCTLDMNHIYNIYDINAAGNGINIMDNSNVSMTGDPVTEEYSETQEIHDCEGIELYTTDNSLPFYMKYNAFLDGDRPERDPLLYYDNRRTGGIPKYDISGNCWSTSGGIDPENDLFLRYGVFKPYPTWCPSNGNPSPVEPDETIYNIAMNDVDSGNFTEAVNLFQFLVVTYPKSEYAKASMKALFETEYYASNDYGGLKFFYLTNDSILSDTSLTELGDFLANKCDIKLNNIGDAISWYENRIQNSVDANDSVFAVIDLGDLYSSMDTTGNKSMIMGSLPQYRPKSMAQYIANRDSLIFLLPFPTDPLKKSIHKLKSGQLLQNVPNPFSSSTDFYFKLLCAVNADIKIYDSWGRLKQVIPITNLTDGTQKITYSTSDLPSGLYEYTLTINGKRTDTKKMIVMR